MKNFKSLLLSIFSFCIILTSCEKDQRNELGYSNQDLVSKTENRNSSHPFYQTTYVKDQLGLNLNRDVSSSYVHDLKSEIQALPYENEIVTAMENRNTFPCWSCGEVDYNDAIDLHVTMVPLVDMTSLEVISILVREKTTHSVNIKYIETSYLKQTVSENLDNPLIYYSKFLEYFEKVIQNETVNVFELIYFKSSNCTKNNEDNNSTGWCRCSGSGRHCSDANNNCDGDLCGGTHEDNVAGEGGTGGGGGTSTPPISFNTFWTILLQSNVPSFGNSDFPYGGGGGGPASGSGPSASHLDFDDILEVLEIIDNLIEYIQSERNIHLSTETISILRGFDYVDLITLPLNVTKEILTDEQLLAYLSFITNHPDFIESLGESSYLQYSSSMSNSLSLFLANHDDELGKDLGHAIVHLFINGLNELPLKGSFINLNKVHDEHNYLLNTYPNFSGENIDPALFIIEHGIKAYLGVSKMYDLFMKELNEIPSLEYQWQLAMEEFSQAIEVALGFVPVVGDLMSAYDNLAQGAIFWACFDLAGVLFPNELFKVVKNADNVKDAWKAAKAFWRVWNKIGNLAGSQKVWNKLPQSWKNLQHSKLANNKKGLRWHKSDSHHFRLMEKNPSSPNSFHQIDYGRFHKGNKYLGRDGNYYLKGSIPIDEFNELTHIPLSEISDTMLDNFFL